MNGTLQASQRNAARAAGLAYLFMVSGGILYWVFVGSRLTVAGNASAAVHAVMANELLFRVGIGYELFMASNVMALAMAHHVILKPIDRNLASLGFHSVLAEAFLAAAMVLAAFIALQLLNGQSSLTALAPAQLQDLVGLYLNVRIAGHTISTVFLSLGMTVFMYLFYRSRYIPKALAAFGMLSYSLMLVAALVNILVPGSPTTMMTMQRTFDVACVAPSILLEVIAGAWLLFKGLDDRRPAAEAEATPPTPGRSS
jgi:hypothetical protein